MIDKQNHNLKKIKKTMEKKLFLVLSLVLLWMSDALHAQEPSHFNLMIQYQDRSTKCFEVNPTDVINPENGISESPIKERCRKLFTEIGTLALVVIDEDEEHMFLYLNDITPRMNELGEEDEFYVDFDTSEFTYGGDLHDMLPLYLTPRLKRLLSLGRIQKIIKLCGINYIWDEDECEMYSQINYKKLSEMLNESAEWFHKDHQDFAYTIE